MIRVVLPAHLRNLAGVTGEVRFAVTGPVTQRVVLDAVEERFPMLRGTIHTLEVQRGTLATLKTMGASMAEAMKQSGVSAEKMANTPFAPFFGQGAAAASAPPAAAPAAPAAPLPTSGDTAQPGTAAAAGAAQDNPAGAAAMPAALAWWNLLQEQFTQAVATAMTPAPQAAGDKDKPAAAKPETPPPAQDAAPSGRTRASRARSDKQ